MSFLAFVFLLIASAFLFIISVFICSFSSITYTYHIDIWYIGRIRHYSIKFRYSVWPAQKTISCCIEISIIKRPYNIMLYVLASQFKNRSILYTIQYVYKFPILSYLVMTPCSLLCPERKHCFIKILFKVLHSFPCILCFLIFSVKKEIFFK